MVTDSMGWTPMMIKTIINEALIHAHDDGRDFLTYKDWLDAADERAARPQAADPSWNLTDRRRARTTRPATRSRRATSGRTHRISKATIIRRGHALGYVQQRPREERTSLYAR